MKFSTLALLLVSSMAVDNMPTALAGNGIQQFTTTTTKRGWLRKLQDEDEGDAPTPDEPEPTDVPSVEEVEEEEGAPDEESTDEDEDGVVVIPEARTCETESSAARVTHECQAETSDGVEGSIEDEIDFEVTAGDKGICIDVKYKQEIEETMTESETKAKFDVCFHKLIEYAKADGSGDEAYDWDADSILQEFDLTAWEDFSTVETNPTNGLSTFSATTSDNEMVTMTFTISPAGDGEGITANSMKADFRLVDFPWVDPGNSYVALLSGVESELEVEVDEEEDDELDDVEQAGDIPDEEEEEPMEEPEPTEETEEPDPTEEMEEPEPTEEMEEAEPTEEDGGEARALDSKPKKPKDVTIPFATVVDTIGFSPLGLLTWADTAVAATTANATEPVAVGRATKIIQVVATSPPEGSERRLVEGKSYEQIAFSFIGEAAKGSPDIFWDPEAGVDYKVESANSGVGALVSTVGIVSGLVSAIIVMAF